MNLNLKFLAGFAKPLPCVAPLFSWRYLSPWPRHRSWRRKAGPGAGSYLVGRRSQFFSARLDGNRNFSRAGPACVHQDVSGAVSNFGLESSRTHPGSRFRLADRVQPPDCGEAPWGFAGGWDQLRFLSRLTDHLDNRISRRASCSFRPEKRRS